MEREERGEEQRRGRERRKREGHVPEEEYAVLDARNKDGLSTDKGFESFKHLIRERHPRRAGTEKSAKEFCEYIF